MACPPRRFVLARRTSTMAVAYLIPLLYITTSLAGYGYNYFNLFLRTIKLPDGTPRWTIGKVNAIPIVGGAVNVVFGEPLPPFPPNLLPDKGSISSAKKSGFGRYSPTSSTPAGYSSARRRSSASSRRLR